MKAIIWRGGNDFKLGEWPDPKAVPGQIVVKVEACSICGSDFDLADFGADPPAVPGHEVAGTVTEIGEGVEGVSVGDRVALDPVERCGACWPCTHGIEHLCVNWRHLGFPGLPGGWAEYLAVNAANAHPVPDNVAFSAASVAEPAAVCYQSFQRAGLREKENVLIIGDGPFGFLHAQVARARGAGTIVVAGHYDRRLTRIAEATGAIPCNTHHQDLSRLLADSIGPPGADIAIEATGHAASPNIGLRALRPRGTLVVFGHIWQPEPIDMGLIQFAELNVLGACRSLDAYEACLEMMGAGRINTGLLVDMEVPLEEYARAFDALSSNKADVFKIVFRP